MGRSAQQTRLCAYNTPRVLFRFNSFFFFIDYTSTTTKKRRSVESERETGVFSLLIAPAIVDGSAKEEKRLKYKKMRRGMLLVPGLPVIIRGTTPLHSSLNGVAG